MTVQLLHAAATNAKQLARPPWKRPWKEQSDIPTCGSSDLKPRLNPRCYPASHSRPPNTLDPIPQNIGRHRRQDFFLSGRPALQCRGAWFHVSMGPPHSDHCCSPSLLALRRMSTTRPAEAKKASTSCSVARQGRLLAYTLASSSLVTPGRPRDGGG